MDEELARTSREINESDKCLNQKFTLNCDFFEQAATLNWSFRYFFVMPAFAEVFNQALQFKLARRFGLFRLPQSSPIAHTKKGQHRAPLPTS